MYERQSDIMTKKPTRSIKSILPKSSLLSGFHIDVDLLPEGVCVCVTGTCGVRSFSSELAQLSLPTGSVLISGEGLSLLLYGQGKAEVRGAIKEVKLSDEGS